MSEGQHIGRVSDAIDNEGGARARMARTMKPTGKAYSGGMSHLGNGDFCPVEGHGKMYVLSSGRQWCPDQSHDMVVGRNRKEAPSDG